MRWTGSRRGSAARRRLEGGFVWVVISSPSWEPLMIRKSNKQGNPVFHTQPWPRPERLCVSSSPPLGAAVSYWDIGGGVGNFPSSTLVGYFCALGPAKKAAHPALGTGSQTKID